MTNERAMESAIVSMGSRWGRRGIPEAWPQRCAWLGGREGWGSRVGSAGGGGGGKPPPSCHSHPEEHRFWSPIQGTRQWAGSKATVSSGPLGFFLLFQGPYFSVVPFLVPSVGASWSVLTLPSSLLFLPVSPSHPALPLITGRSQIGILPSLQ